MTDTHLLADDARRLLDELDRDVPGAAQQTGECRPAIDVFETTEAAEVLVDVMGVAPSALRVAVRKNTVLVVGAKLAPPQPSNIRFHLAERAFGAFARAVRVTGAFDAGRAKAVVANGVLRVVLPRIEDRRGLLRHIPVEVA